MWGLLGISAHTLLTPIRPWGPFLEPQDGLMLPRLWLVQEGLGPSTFSNTHTVNLSASRKEPSSGHLWHA